MAIENELKYVLSDGSGLEIRLAGMMAPQRIEQAYLAASARIRRVNGLGCLFTYKHRLKDGSSVEIETPIEARFYDLLARDCTRSLRKHRYKLPAGVVRWDVDFFKAADGGGNYFAMAEAEMPAGMAIPAEIHPLLQPYLLFSVPRTDRRFSSFLLTDEAYAKGLAEEIGILQQDVAAD
jgi:CYTH domain-containing protein